MLLRFKVGKCLLQSCLGTAWLIPCSYINMAQFFLNQKRPNPHRNSDSVTPPFPILWQSKLSPSMSDVSRVRERRDAKSPWLRNSGLVWWLSDLNVHQSHVEGIETQIPGPPLPEFWLVLVGWSQEFTLTASFLVMLMLFWTPCSENHLSTG